MTSGDGDRLRVVFLSPHPDIGGGAERVFHDHLHELDRRRFAPYVAAWAPFSDAGRAAAAGAEVFSFRPHDERRPWTMVREIVRFGRFVRRNRIDVVVGNKHRSILYWALSPARRTKFVWVLHDPVPEGRLSGIINRVVGRLRPDGVVWVTTVVRESYQSRFPRLRSVPARQIPPGARTEQLLRDANGTRAREHLELPPDAPIVAMFARMQPSKGHVTLLAAAGEVLQRNPDVRFVICGGSAAGEPTAHEEAVRQAVLEGGLSHRVLLLGIVSEASKRDILASATVVVHPADWEPFGIAVLEGMAAGKPVVVTDASGPASIVEHMHTGFVVPRGDSAALAHALTSVIVDPSLAARLGEAGAQVVADRYESAASTRRLEALLAEVAGTGPAAMHSGRTAAQSAVDE